MNSRHRKTLTKEVGKMLKFIIGLFIGDFIGIITMYLCVAAGDANKCENPTDKDEQFCLYW